MTLRLPAGVPARGRRWLDPALTAVLLVGSETELLTSRQLHGPIVLNVLVMAGTILPVAWRRRWPLIFAAIVMSLSVLMITTLTNLSSILVPTYVLLVPPYTVAAHERRGRALVGLAICVVGPMLINTVASHASVSDYAFTLGLVGAAWATGRAIRTHRQLAEELTRKAERIAAEREVRERLVVADERTRIARELHAVVANSVTAMVVQTAAAERLLDHDPSAADEAMAAIEQTGRQALIEMRRILGVLRRGDETMELAPQPGVGQIHRLVEDARDARRRIELHVEGDPGPLPASVDLGVYRILEDALATPSQRSSDLVEVSVRFGERDVELMITSHSEGAASWPTLAMRERLEVCGGELAVEPAGTGRRLIARLPRTFEEVFV
jgi:signal transduction histidine kinase